MKTDEEIIAHALSMARTPELKAFLSLAEVQKGYLAEYRVLERESFRALVGHCDEDDSPPDTLWYPTEMVENS